MGPHLQFAEPFPSSNRNPIHTCFLPFMGESPCISNTSSWGNFLCIWIPFGVGILLFIYTWNYILQYWLPGWQLLNFIHSLPLLLDLNLLFFIIKMLFCHFYITFCRNGVLTEELECQLTTSVTAKKEDDSDSDLDID